MANPSINRDALKRVDSLYKYFLFVCTLTCLSSCTIPKKIELTSADGLSQSHCAVLKFDAFLVLWDFDSLKKLKIARLDILATDKKISEFYEGRSERIPKGTRLKIDTIETWWDFENADRVTILGSVLFDSQETPFSFEQFTGPDVTSYIQKRISPC